MLCSPHYVRILVQLTADPTLEFTEAAAIQPPSIAMNPDELRASEHELAQAAAMPLPADDDDDL